MSGRDDKYLWHMDRRDEVIERVEDDKRRRPPTSISEVHRRHLEGKKNRHKNLVKRKRLVSDGEDVL